MSVVLPAAIVARRRLYLQAICARRSRGKKSENNARVLIILLLAPATSSFHRLRDVCSPRFLREGSSPSRRPFVDAPCASDTLLSSRPPLLSPPLHAKMRSRSLPAHSCVITCARFFVACLSGALARRLKSSPRKPGKKPPQENRARSAL